MSTLWVANLVSVELAGSAGGPVVARGDPRAEAVEAARCALLQPPELTIGGFQRVGSGINTQVRIRVFISLMFIYIYIYRF